VIASLSILAGFASVIWMFGWMGALASVALVALMLAAMKR
jgi:hypothetical protein